MSQYFALGISAFIGARCPETHPIIILIMNNGNSVRVNICMYLSAPISLIQHPLATAWSAHSRFSSYIESFKVVYVAIEPVRVVGERTLKRLFIIGE